MTDSAPHALTDREWEELAGIDDVRDAWGLEPGEDGAALKERGTYAVRFDFVSGSPGYVGPLYLLKGDGDPACPPLHFIRRDGELILLEGW